MSGNEDYRHGDASIGELLLQLEPVGSGEAHVEDEAHGCVLRQALPEVLRRAHGHDGITDGAQEPGDGVADVVVIIQHVDDRLPCGTRGGNHPFHAVSDITGRSETLETAETYERERSRHKVPDSVATKTIVGCGGARALR